MKKLLISLMLLAILTASCSVVYGYSNITTPKICYLCSLGYSVGSNKVLNVYTSGAPAPDDLVTIYDYSGSSSQKWVIRSNDDMSGIPSDTYRITSYGNASLALNYDSSTTKCIVDGYSVYNYTKFPILFNYETGGGYSIWLYYFSNRYLGNSGSSNGAQCYWYVIGNSGIHSEDIWLML